MLEEKLFSVMKPQNVDDIPKIMKGKVGDIITKKDNTGRSQALKFDLELDKLYDRSIENLSGG